MSFDMSDTLNGEAFDFNAAIDRLVALKNAEKERRSEAQAEINRVNLTVIVHALYHWQEHHNWSALADYIQKVKPSALWKRVIAASIPANADIKVVNKVIRIMSSNGEHMVFDDTTDDGKARIYLMEHLEWCNPDDGLKHDPITDDFKKTFPDESKVNLDKAMKRLKGSMERTLDRLSDQGELPDQEVMMEMIRDIYVSMGHAQVTDQAA